MTMFPLWVQFICILHFLAAVQGVPPRGNQLYSSTISKRKPTKEDPYSVQFSSEESRENVQQLPLQNARIFPTSVYNFQTGEVELPNWDLSESSSNQFSQETQNSGEAPAKQVVVEARPRRYSSKYAQGEESNIDENYEILKNPRPEEEQKLEEPELEVKNSQPEESEQYKVYDQTEKPAELDNVKAESGHHKAPVSTKHQKGSGEEHHEDHHNKKKTKGLKDYKGEHHYHKGEKGHHDKENHKGQYSDKKGSTHAHKEGGGHFQSAVHGEKGQKEAKHSDKEEYKKGHSTRGGHTVHKKDEYEKKHEFYDEHHEGGDSEKHGEYFEEHQAKKGGHKKGGHKSGEAAGEHKAKKGHFEKGKKYHELIGHKKTGGHEKKHGHDEKYGKKEAHSNFKKYGYDSGGKGGDSGGAHSNNDHLHLAVPPVPPSIAEAAAAVAATSSVVDPAPIIVHKILKPQPAELQAYKEVVRNPPPEILKKVETVETIKVVDPPSAQESRQVFSETAPAPSSSELNPTIQKEQPKVTITRFKFPPAENSPAK